MLPTPPPSAPTDRAEALAANLRGGDRRSIGRSDEVTREVLATRRSFPCWVAMHARGDALVAMRAADAMEKITRKRPDLLEPYRSLLLGPMADSPMQEVRWHVAQMLPRILWSHAQRKRVLALLERYSTDASSIVKTCAMQALADLARTDPALRTTVLRRLLELTATGTPAMRARGRKLVAELEKTAGAADARARRGH